MPGHGSKPAFAVYEKPSRSSIEVRESSDAQQIDLAIVGPDGAVSTAYGWWGWEQCCINDPWIVLSDSPQLDVTQGRITSLRGARRSTP